MVELPDLPYAKDALEPVISSRTLEFHHDKHHKAYVDTTNKLISGTDLENAPLVDIIKAAYKDDSKLTLFNNAAQVWNHNFYWKCLTPKEKSVMPDELRDILIENFGSVEAFKKELVAAGVGQFGSGWAWVMLEDGKLSISKTPNAEDPWTEKRSPVLTLDVWEHAYYLDFQNRRQAYLEEVVDNIVNWEYMLKNIKRFG